MTLRIARPGFSLRAHLMGPHAGLTSDASRACFHAAAQLLASKPMCKAVWLAGL